jgi:hypothetical protein
MWSLPVAPSSGYGSLSDSAQCLDNNAESRLCYSALSWFSLEIAMVVSGDVIVHDHPHRLLEHEVPRLPGWLARQMYGHGSGR